MLGLRYEGTHIASPHVGAHHDTSLAVLAADLVRAGRKFECGDFTQRNEIYPGFCRTWQRYGQPFHTFQVVAQGLREANKNIESTVSLEHGAGLTPADGRGHCVLDVSNVQSIARGLLAVDVHSEHRKPRRLLYLDLG